MDQVDGTYQLLLLDMILMRQNRGPVIKCSKVGKDIAANATDMLCGMLKGFPVIAVRHRSAPDRSAAGFMCYVKVDDLLLGHTLANRTGFILHCGGRTIILLPA